MWAVSAPPGVLRGTAFVIGKPREVVLHRLPASVRVERVDGLGDSCWRRVSGTSRGKVPIAHLAVAAAHQPQAKC